MYLFIYNKYFASFYVYNGPTNLNRSFTKFNSPNKNRNSFKILPVVSGDWQKPASRIVKIQEQRKFFDHNDNNNNDENDYNSKN